MFEAGHYALDVLWLFSNGTGLSVGGIGSHYDLIDAHIPGSPFALLVEHSCGLATGAASQADCMQSMAVSPYVTRPPCGYAAGTSPGRWMRCDVCAAAAHPHSLACDCANAWNLVWVPYDCFLYHTSTHRHLWMQAHRSVSNAAAQSDQCALAPGIAFSGTSQQRTLFYRFASVYFHLSRFSLSLHSVPQHDRVHACRPQHCNLKVARRHDSRVAERGGGGSSVSLEFADVQQGWLCHTYIVLPCAPLLFGIQPAPFS